jgi:ketosteroid isomerase-like protein
MSTATVKGQSSRDEANIRALIETVHKAHHSKDAAAIVAPYARAAAVFCLAPPLSHIGMDLEEKRCGSTPGKGQSI